PAGDVEMAVRVEKAHVAGPEAAVLHEDRLRLLRTVVIALHDVRALHDDLTVLRVARDRAIDLDRDVWDRLPDAAQLAVPGVVRGGDGAGLRQAVALVDRDAERVDERRDVGAERRAAPDGVLEPAAEALADRREDQAIGEGEHELVDRADRLAARLALGSVDAVPEEPLDDARPGRDLRVHALVQPIEDTGDRVEHG